MDGVICSTDAYHYLAWKKIADKIGIDFDEKANNRLRGIGRMESLEILLSSHSGRFSEKDKKKYAEEKNLCYRAFLQKMSPADLSPEVRTTLDQIRSKGLKLAIGSSSKNAKLILQKLGLENYFDAVTDGNDIARSKPDPEVYLKASACLGIDPSRCLVIEDALSGLEAASAAKMDSAAIGDAAGNRQATYHLSRFSDLLLYL